MLRGHYAYYGVAGNFRALQRVHRAVERFWRRMLSSRSWKGEIWWKYGSIAEFAGKSPPVAMNQGK
jgi:hypothetical protein